MPKRMGAGALDGVTMVVLSGAARQRLGQVKDPHAVVAIKMKDSFQRIDPIGRNISSSADSKQSDINDCAFKRSAGLWSLPLTQRRVDAGRTQQRWAGPNAVRPYTPCRLHGRCYLDHGIPGRDTRRWNEFPVGSRCTPPDCVFFTSHRSSLEVGGQPRWGEKQLSAFIFINIVG